MRHLCSRTLVCLLALLLLDGCGRSPRKPKSEPAKIRANYAFGEVISFGRGGKSAIYKGVGWGDTEEGMTWTNGHFARVTFVLPDTAQPVRIQMRLHSFTNPPTLTFQPVVVLVNDEPVAEWQVTGEATDYVAIVPNSVANHEKFNVELRLPEAVSPRVLEVSDDARLLGVACSEMRITEGDAADNPAPSQEQKASEQADLVPGKAYTFGTILKFGIASGTQRFKGPGWYPAERDFTWTDREAQLQLTVPKSDRPLKLKMKLSGNIHPETLPFQPTEVRVNGHKVAEWNVGAQATFEATIPTRILADADSLAITLLVPKAVAPKALNVGADTRILGIRGEELVITEEDAVPEASPQ